jgi:hypothetical protein
VPGATGILPVRITKPCYDSPGRTGLFVGMQDLRPVRDGARIAQHFECWDSDDRWIAHSPVGTIESLEPDLAGILPVRITKPCYDSQDAQDYSSACKIFVPLGTARE